MDDLIKRWLELKEIPSSKLTTIQLEEQFHLAQALTAKLRPDLYEQLVAHRARCLKLLRDSERINRGTKYSMMSPDRPLRHPSWTEIELTPDITFTVSEELVGCILPAGYAKGLKRMIQLQARCLAQLRRKE